MNEGIGDKFWFTSGILTLCVFVPAVLQGLEILKASLHSSTVLTDVFLRGKKALAL